MPVCGNRATRRRPTQISERPVSGLRPSTTRTLDRTVQAWSPTPRATTFATCVVSKILGSGTRTYTSGLTRGFPSAPVATWGAAARMLATSRDRPLDSSESAPRRSTSRFRSDPVRTRAVRKPFASASMPMNTATTSAMPSAVKAVDTGRCSTLRTL